MQWWLFRCCRGFYLLGMLVLCCLLITQPTNVGSTPQTGQTEILSAETLQNMSNNVKSWGNTLRCMQMQLNNLATTCQLSTPQNTPSTPPTPPSRMEISVRTLRKLRIDLHNLEQAKTKILDEQKKLGGQIEQLCQNKDSAYNTCKDNLSSVTRKYNEVKIMENQSVLAMTSDPAGAHIWIDGIQQKNDKQQPEVTNQSFWLKEGNHTIRLTKEGYEDYTLDITLKKYHAHPKSAELKMYAAGKSIIVNGLKINHDDKHASTEASFIPPGTFLMGSHSGESLRDTDEKQHYVKLSRGFWMMKTEVTRSQFKSLMQYDPSKKECEGDNERCPVDSVTWHEAAAFANALSQKEVLEMCFTCTGNKKEVSCTPVADYIKCKGWRLPTEAEWEYAARAGTITPFSTGDCISTDQANYNGNHPYTNCPSGVYRNKVVDVSSFGANAWGLHNMHGNVWEWVHDWYADYDVSIVPAVDSAGASNGSQRVLRGGSWYFLAQHLRSAFRNGRSPSDAFDYVGFRLSRSLP